MFSTLQEVIDFLWEDEAPDYANRDWDEHMRKEDAAWKFIVDRSAASKALDSWIGRAFTRGVADGKALYTIEEIDGNIANLQCWPIFDSYQDGTIAAMDNCVPLKVAQKFVEQEEAIAELFSGNSS